MAHNRRAADKAASQRTRSEAESAAARQALAHGASVASGEELAAEIRRLIPRVLDVRASRDYAGIRQVTRSRRTLLGGYKNETIGAYPVCKVDVMAHGEPQQRDLLLASDGRLTPWDLDEIMGILRDRPSGPRADLFTVEGLRKIVAGLNALL